MFEKEAEEYTKKLLNPSLEYAFKDGAEFGYNKAKIEVEDSYRESLCNSELNLTSVTEQLEELEKQIKKMKNCSNCRHSEEDNKSSTICDECFELCFWEMKE